MVFTVVVLSTTYKVSVLSALTPPSHQLTTPFPFTSLFRSALVTFTVTVHELLTAMLPPVNDTLPDPAVAVGVPPQVLVRPMGVATSRLAGKVSVNPTPVSASVLADGLVMVIVRALAPFTTM